MIERILKDIWISDNEWSISVLRYFNPIGAHKSGLIGEDPRDIPNNLLPYITQVASGKREYLMIHGNDYDTHDGTGVRDYIHVVDLAKAHLCAMERASKRSGIEYFNIGTGVGYSVLDVVKAYEEATGIKIKYKIGPRRPGDIDECYANPEKAYKILGWKAENDIVDMCKDAYNWQTNNPCGYDE
jgi:UDP-glucose 4-epimerase